MLDLHTHTTFSDGSYTPTELVTAAAELGLTAVAVTDHDTVDGLPEALAAGERMGFRVVPGVELNLEHERTTMDMLGYFLHGGPGPQLDEELAELRRYRDERNAAMLARLEGLGLPLAPDELEAAAGESAVGRPHIGLAMMRRGYVDSVAEAFRLYLRRGAPAWVDRRRLSLQAAVRLLSTSGAVAVLAHPGLIRSERGLDALVRDAAEAGVAGIECYHPAHDVEMIACCEGLASRYDLVITGGSDFHGAMKPHVHLGLGPGGMRFPDELLAGLIERSNGQVKPRLRHA